MIPHFKGSRAAIKDLRGVFSATSEHEFMSELQRGVHFETMIQDQKKGKAVLGNNW